MPALNPKLIQKSMSLQYEPASEPLHGSTSTPSLNPKLFVPRFPVAFRAQGGGEVEVLAPNDGTFHPYWSESTLSS